MTAPNENQTVEVKTGYPNPVVDALVSVMGAEPTRVLLGVDEPDGTETTQWYADGDILVASGRRWRVTDVRAPGPLAPDAPPGSGAGRTVAVLHDADAS